MPVKAFAAKYREKHECYHFLSSDCGVYLPDFESVTAWHMRDLISSKKKKILSKNIKHLSVPQYEDLTIKNFIAWSEPYEEVMECLPASMLEIKKLPRQYLINVIYTIMGSEFKQYVDELIQKRHQRIAEDATQNIIMDADIVEAFQKSQAINTSKGNSYQLLKAGSKRRRGKL